MIKLKIKIYNVVYFNLIKIIVLDRLENMKMVLL